MVKDKTSPDAPERGEWVTRRTLLMRVKDKGDQDAWSEFAFYYRKYIYNLVRRMGLSHHDAEEVVQTVLVKAWGALPTFDYKPEKGRFRGWLCKVSGNEAKNHLRALGRRMEPLETLDWDSEEQSAENATIRPEIERFAESEWERYLPELAWKTVSKEFEPQVLKCFQLFAEGIDVKEIARRTGVAESSVYVYKKRVQDRLTKEVARLQKEL